MPVANAHAHITTAVAQWPNIVTLPHRFGGTEFRLGTREIGHIHNDSVVDIPFPTKVRHALVAAGRAEPHHILPNTGWVSVWLRTPADVERALELLQLSLEIAQKQQKNADFKH